MCTLVPGSYSYSPIEALNTSEHVFEGEITKVTKGVLPKEYRVTFKIIRVWKNDAGESITLRTFR